MATVFLSHSSKDKEFVRRLAADLRAAGHTPWLDEWDIQVGDSIPTKLESGLQDADYVVVVLSPNSIQSGWVGQEWKTKVWDEVNAKRTMVLPVLYRKCQIPSLLKTKKYADFTAAYDEGLRQLLAALAPASPIGRDTSCLGAGSEIVESSGNWCLLHDRFMETRSVRRTKNQITVEVASDDAELDAAISALGSNRFGRSGPVGFAYRNEAWLVRAADIEASSVGDEHVWTAVLTPEDMKYGAHFSEIAFHSGGRQYSVDDIAKLRAGRILLNDPPPAGTATGSLKDAFGLEAFVAGVSTPIKVQSCPIRATYQRYRSDPSLFLRLARLAALLYLRAGGVVAEVHYLKLGPIEDHRVRVSFRGSRGRLYDNVAPVTIAIDGECPLE